MYIVSYHVTFFYLCVYSSLAPAPAQIHISYLVSEASDVESQVFDPDLLTDQVMVILTGSEKSVDVENTAAEMKSTNNQQEPRDEAKVR